MASIGEITQGSSYRGDPALGNGLGVGVTIDPSPLQRLSTFTFYANRDKWEQQQKKDALAAQRIANIAAFDTNSPFREYTDDLTKEVNELQNDIRKDPSIIIYDRNKPEKWIELQQRIGRIENKRKRATVNDVLYNAAKAKIELEPKKEKRDQELKLLDIKAKKLFRNGVEEGYRQQFEAMPELKPQSYVVPEVPMTDDFFITQQPNSITINGNKYADIPRIFSMADAIYFGLNKKVDENTPEFQGMSEEARIENDITSKSRTELDNVAASANSLIDQFKAINKKPDGTDIKVSEIPEETLLENPTIGGVISLAKSFNETVDKINAASGKKNPHINLDDGISPRELIVLETFGKNKDSFFSELKPTVQQNNDDIERRKLSLGWANFNKDGGSGISKDAIENPAIQFGGHINRVKTYFQDNPKSGGMIVRFSGLDEDTKKALGLYKQDSEGKLVPVELKGNNSYVTYFNDGTYKVGTNYKGDGGNPGTLETLRQGYINTVKAGLNKEGVQSEGFQKNAEDGFRKIFSVNNAEAIWDSWSGGGDKKQESGGDYYNSQDNVQSQSGNRITYKDGTVWEIKGNKLNKIK